MITTLPSVGTALSGYDCVVVEEYFAAVAVERERLLRDIADARARVLQARRALDCRRVLGAMLESAYDEIAAKRRQSELVVNRIAGDGRARSAIHWHAPTHASLDSCSVGARTRP